MSSNEKILLVDDNPTNLQVLYGTLEDEGYELMIAKNGESAIEIAQKAKPQLILLDIMMPPGIDGYETCKRLKADPKTAEAAVIFLSALDQTKNKIEGFNLGAVDYISKPFKDEEVIARVKTHLTIQRLTQELKVELMVAQEILGEIYKRLEGPLLGTSGAVKKLREEINTHNHSDETLLLIGAPGSGDEAIARSIHHQSNRRNRPFIHVLCSTVIENHSKELFGQSLYPDETNLIGKFDLASGGTIYLDGINCLKPALQEQLLALLDQIHEKQNTLDIRLIAYSTASLSEGVRKGTFLKELADLLKQRRLNIPTLAERKEDIPLLTKHFIEQTANKLGKIVQGISEQSHQRLMNYHWPGNIRELRDLLHHIVINSTEAVMEIDEGFFDDVTSGIVDVQINFDTVKDEVDQLLKDFTSEK
jgi:formate hydrogenlyase transcriptional activator